MSSGNLPRTTKPLSLPNKRGSGPLKTKLPDEPVLSPWAVRFVAPDQTIPVQVRIDDKALIGRSDPDSTSHPEVDLAPYGASDQGISRRHAEIRAGRDYLVVIDLNSTNGTRINGEKLVPNEPYRLSHGDSLSVGAMTFEVQIEIMPVHEGVKVVKANVGLLGKHPDEENARPYRQILIVEDDADTANAYAGMVTALGYKATIVNRTGDAMRFIASEVPDSVLIDWDMPDFPGTEICRMIKSDMANVHVPIFAISKDTDEKTIKSALEAGADVFLGKPVGINELMQGLQKFLKNTNPDPE